MLVSNACLETCAMGWSALVTHTAAPVGLAVTFAIVIRHILDAILRLIAGLVAILADDERPRADRALDVLRLLRHNRGLPPSSRQGK
jgi:hypothetical protein